MSWYEEWQPWRAQPFIMVAVGVMVVVAGVAARALWTEGASPWSWLMPIGLPAVFVVFFLLGGLRTRVESDGVVVQMVGLRTRRLAWADIRMVEAVTIRPLAEFGGWGIRYGGKAGWLYNIKGKQAVRFTLAEGRLLTVGSQDATRLVTAIEAVRPQG